MSGSAWFFPHVPYGCSLIYSTYIDGGGIAPICRKCDAAEFKRIGKKILVALFFPWTLSIDFTLVADTMQNLKFSNAFFAVI